MLASQIQTDQLDDDADSPRLARVQLLESLDTINKMLANNRLQALPNPIVVPVDGSGTPNLVGVGATLQVFRFNEEETSSWAFSVLSQTNTTVNLVGASFTVTSIDKDVGYVMIKATRSGYNDLLLQIPVQRATSTALPSAPDSTAPPTPTGFSGSAGINTLILTWNPATYTVGRGPGATNLYGAVWDGVSAKPIFSSPSVKRLASFMGANNLVSFPSEPNLRWCLWIKFETKDGVESTLPAPVGLSNGLELQTGQDPSALLAILTSQIAQSQLASALSSKINLITDADTVIGSVSQRIKEEADARALAVSNLNVSLSGQINQEISDRVAVTNLLMSVKNRSFYSSTAPVSDSNYTLVVNDRWFDTSNGLKSYRWNGSAWIPADDTRIAQAVADIQSEASARAAGDTAEVVVREALYAGIQGVSNTEYKVFVQETAPSATAIGDVWTWKTPAGVETFRRWSGVAWVDSLSDKRAARYLGTFATASLPTTGNVFGDLARRSEDNSVAVWTYLGWITRSVSIAPTWAFVEQERTARTNADSAEAALRVALATQVTGGYSGNDINAVTSGLLFQEKTARSSADASEVAARESLYAGTGSVVGTDYRLFNQDTTPTATAIGDIWTWKTGAGVETFSRWSGTAWVPSADKRPAKYLGVFAAGSLPTTGNVIGDVARQSSDNGVYVWNGTTWVAKTTNSYPIWAFVEQEKTARSSADSAEAALRVALQTQLVGNYAGSNLALLTSGLLYDEQQARSAADSSEVTARQLLSTKVLGSTDPNSVTLNTLTSGLIFDERTARSTADTSEATARQLISTKAFGVADPSSATLASLTSGIIFDERQARSSADASEVTARQLLSTKLIGTTDPNSVTLNTLASGLIFDEKTARVSAVGAQATRIDQLEASVNSPTIGNNPTYAALQTEASVRANFDGYVAASYSIRAQVTAGGRTSVGGIGLYGSSSAAAGPNIDLAFLANRIWFGAPNDGSAPGVADIQPFVVQTTDQTVNGVLIPKGVYIDAAFIKNLTALIARLGTAWITDAMISQLNATKLTVGDGSVGGNLKSTNYSPTNGWILRPDGTAELLNAIIKGTLQVVNISTSGVILGGMPSYGSGSGFALGYDGGEYGLVIGNKSGSYLEYKPSFGKIRIVNADLSSTNAVVQGFFASASQSTVGSAAAAAAVQFLSDGRIQRVIGTTATDIGNWYSPTTANIGSSYSLIATGNAENQAGADTAWTGSSSPRNTQIAISSTVGFGLNQPGSLPGQHKQGALNISIIKNSTGRIEGSGSISVYVANDA